MAIRMMTTKEHAEKVGYVNIEKVYDYLGAEVGRVRHNCRKCTKANHYDRSGSLSEGCCKGSSYKDGKHIPSECGEPYCMGCSVITEPLYMEVSYQGRVLESRERNYYDDSDFYAVVWDDATGRPKEVEYATTRAWTYPNSCVVDATPEVLEKYRAWKEAQRQAYIAEKQRQEMLTPSRGKKVRVVKGRKLSHGTEGIIFWVGSCNYNRYRTRVGIQLTNGDKVFTDASNVEVII